MAAESWLDKPRGVKLPGRAATGVLNTTRLYFGDKRVTLDHGSDRRERCDELIGRGGGPPHGGRETSQLRIIGMREWR